MPGLSWEITRPNAVHLVGLRPRRQRDRRRGRRVRGRGSSSTRLDHLDGVLLVERLDPDQRREAKRRVLAERAACRAAPGDPDGPRPTAGAARCAWPSSARPRRPSPSLRALVERGPRRGPRRHATRPASRAWRGAEPQSRCRRRRAELGLEVAIRPRRDLAAAASNAASSSPTARWCPRGAARRVADAQRALLAPAALARRGAGRARDPRGRRRDRGVDHDPRGDARHRSGPPDAPTSRSTTRRRAELTGELADLGAAALVEVLATPHSLAATRAHRRRGHLRRASSRGEELHLDPGDVAERVRAHGASGARLHRRSRRDACASCALAGRGPTGDRRARSPRWRGRRASWSSRRARSSSARSCPRGGRAMPATRGGAARGLDARAVRWARSARGSGPRLSA